jgi:serine/threonine protein kinase
VESSEFDFEKKSDNSTEHLVYQGKYFSVHKVKRNHRWEICKSINDIEVNNPVCLESLRREFEIGSQLQHPFICSYYHYSLNDNYIHREYIDGLSWNDYFQTYPHEKLSIGTYFIQLIEAVTYLHAKGVFHMDLKSENFILNYELKILKIIDFGHAVYQNDTLWRGGTKSTIQNERSISAKHDWDCIFHLFDGQEFSTLKEFLQKLERIKLNYQNNNFKIDLGFAKEIIDSKRKSISKTSFIIATGILLFLVLIIYFISNPNKDQTENRKEVKQLEKVDEPKTTKNNIPTEKANVKNNQSEAEISKVKSSRTIPEKDSLFLVKMANQFGFDMEKEIPKDANAQTKRELFNSLIKRYTDKFDQCQELKHLNPERLEKAKKIYDFHISKSANTYIHILK